MIPSLILLAASALPAGADETWPTSGGDGGKVIEVTKLDDQGEGTLRHALSRSGRRVIVFKVAGDIMLSRPLLIDKPFVTVAGETAPSPGITLLGDKIRIVTHDVTLRHLRVRVGENGTSKPENRDGISIEGGHADARGVARILIDHCSVAWAVDEGLSIWGSDVRDVAVRNTIVAETLRNSIHPKGEHSMGMMVGPGTEAILIQKNLLAHNAWRNPVVHGGANAVVVNNVIYNPRYAGLHFYVHEGSGRTLVAAVGNVLIAGPDTVDRPLALSKGINSGSEIFYQDNVASGAIAFDTSESLDPPQPDLFVEAPPVWFEGLDVLAAADVTEKVLADVGARPWDRDAVDARIVAEVIARTGGLKDRPDDERLVMPKEVRAALEALPPVKQ